jgi:hypothetical protein
VDSKEDFHYIKYNWLKASGLNGKSYYIVSKDFRGEQISFRKNLHKICIFTLEQAKGFENSVYTYNPKNKISIKIIKAPKTLIELNHLREIIE